MNAKQFINWGRLLRKCLILLLFDREDTQNGKNARNILKNDGRMVMPGPVDFWSFN